LISFDLGVKLRGESKLDMQEDRLRQRLNENPMSVSVMANLGAAKVRTARK
jgi:hypothetical protein